LGLPFALPLKKLRLEGKAHPKLFYPVLAVLVFFALRKKYAGGYKSGIPGKIRVRYRAFLLYIFFSIASIENTLHGGLSLLAIINLMQIIRAITTSVTQKS
jgi:hypothetical protein